MSHWIHVKNPFEVATHQSRKKMLILITDHTSRLQGGSAVPAINTLHTRTLPVKNNFSAKYSAWNTAAGQWKAETKRVNTALKDLSGTKIGNWDVRIQVVFADGTPDYIALLPNHRIPFQQGTIDTMISAVDALAQALDAYPLQPDLVTLKGEVETFYTDILGKRNVQQQKEQAVQVASSELETARLETAEMMFRNLGVLIDLYANDPDQITNYYQLNLVRDTGSNETEYSDVLTPGEQKLITNTGINKESIIYAKNTGDTAFQIYLADNGTEPPTPDAQTLQPGDEITTSPGDVPAMTAYFLLLKNLSNVLEGSYLILII